MESMYWRMEVTYLDVNGELQTEFREYTARGDAIDAVEEVVRDASYYPEDATLQRVCFLERGVSA